MIHKELVTASGHSAVSYSTIQRWSKKVNDEEMEIECNPRCGPPVSETTEESIELVKSGHTYFFVDFCRFFRVLSIF